MKKKRFITAGILVIWCIIGMIYTYLTPDITRTAALCIAIPGVVILAYFSAIMNPNIK